jgi:hypothetical protein
VLWINPQRRTRALVVGLVAAVVLLGGGIGIGVAIGDSGGHSHSRFVPAGDRGGYGPRIGNGGVGQYQGPAGARPGNGGNGRFGNGNRPGQPANGGSTTPSAPSPTTTPN